MAAIWRRWAVLRPTGTTSNTNMALFSSCSQPSRTPSLSLLTWRLRSRGLNTLRGVGWGLGARRPTAEGGPATATRRWRNFATTSTSSVPRRRSSDHDGPGGQPPKSQSGQNQTETNGPQSDPDPSGGGSHGQDPPPPPPDWLKLMTWALFTAPVAFIAVRAFRESRERASSPPPSADPAAWPTKASGEEDVLSWNDFYQHLLKAGEVKRVIVHQNTQWLTVELLGDAYYHGRPAGGRRFRVQLNRGDQKVEERIRDFERQAGIPPSQGVTILHERISGQTGQLMATVVLVGGMLATFLLARRFFSGLTSKMGGGPLGSMTKASFTLIDPRKGKGKGVRFADVAGMKEAKTEVREFVDYLKHPERYRALGAKPPKGAILYGPPGCGKTMLAKAVATEAMVPFLSMNGSEFIEMIGGLGAARVRSLFKEARQLSPSIIYIDEIDAIGKQRNGGVGGQQGGRSMEEADQTLNQLLVEMDGIASKEGVILLASTNRSDVLDKALLRPGRFDRQILIDHPTVLERKEILEKHLERVKLEEPAAVYSERLATLTVRFSGADLANLVNEAVLHAARMKQDLVKKENFEYAVERVIAGPEKKTSVLSPGEKKVVAYHESGHALVGWMLKNTDALLKVTILPRTSQALGFAQYAPMEKKLYSPDDLMDRMCMALGGRVAEALTFNRVTTGAQNDLEKVTKMAYSQIQLYGFNERVGLRSFEDTGGQKPFSRSLQATIDQEARLLVAKAYQRTEALLREHKQDLEKMSMELLARETLNYQDVEALLGPPPHGKKHLVTPSQFEEQLRQQAESGSQQQQQQQEQQQPSTPGKEDNGSPG